MINAVHRGNAGVATIGVLLIAAIGAASLGWGPTSAQESTPADHAGVHGQGTATEEPAGTPSPYAAGFDAAARIRSLGPEEIADIERGAGARFALPEEVNGVPGPRHVLDLAAELSLTPEQTAAVQAVADEMLAAVIPAGRAYLDAILALEADFRAGTLTEANLPARVIDVGRLEGELAASHLTAHLRTATLLTSAQIAEYTRLRGRQ